MSSDEITIGDKTYRKEGPWFRVPFDNLGDFRIRDLPPHSSLEVTGLPTPPEGWDYGITAINDGTNLSLYGGPEFTTTERDGNAEESLRRRVEWLVRNGTLRDPYFISRPTKDAWQFGVGFSTIFHDEPNITVREAATPLMTLFRHLNRPEAHIFVCYASEDKPIARQLASFVTSRGANVWLDQWEIRVGDSIVEKINSGLGAATHLAVLFSAHSITKPWVTREMSSALMRQLADRSIQILPIRLDDSPLPPIITDIRYADCRKDLHVGFNELIAAVFQTPGAID